MNFEAQPTQGTTKSIQRISKVLDVACVVMMIALPLGTIWNWTNGDQAMLAREAQLASDAIKGTLESWQRGCGALIALIPVLFQITALRQSQRCFRSFANGQVFEGVAVRHMKLFAGWMLASYAVNAIAKSAHSVILTFGNPPGEHVFLLGLGVDMWTVMYLGIVWLMAAVIGYGQTIAQENAHFV